MQVYVSKDGQQFGPFTVEQLRQYVRQGHFTTADYACCDGQNWVTVAQIPGFATGGDSVTTPQQPQEVQRQAGSTASGSEKKKIIFWSSIGGIATLAMAGLLIWLLGGDEGGQAPAEPLDSKPAQVGEIDLDDSRTRNKIIAAAIDLGKLEYRHKAAVAYPPNQQTAYTDSETETRNKIIAAAMALGKLEDGYKAFVAYAPNQQTAYTGWAKATYDNGQIMMLSQIKDGKPDGLSTSWHPSGQKMWETTWKDDKLVTAAAWKWNGVKNPDINVVNGNGVRVEVEHYDGRDGESETRVIFKDGEIFSRTISWYKYGQKELEHTYKNVERFSWTEISWYRNGQKREEGTYKNEHLIAAIVWRPNGEKCPDTNFVNGNGVHVTYLDSGKEFSRHTYKDGVELNVTWSSYYKNGQKKQAYTEDDILTAVVVWKPSGEKCPETNVVNGNGVWVYYNDDGTEAKRMIYKDGECLSRTESYYYDYGQKSRELTTYAKDMKLITAVSWKPNGEKCPVTNVKDGSGVLVWYNEDGEEYARHIYKDGRRTAK